jgi:hypothetical protein
MSSNSDYQILVQGLQPQSSSLFSSDVLGSPEVLAWLRLQIDLRRGGYWFPRHEAHRKGLI